jgi:hypothetical protein
MICVQRTIQRLEVIRDKFGMSFVGTNSIARVSKEDFRVGIHKEVVVSTVSP